MPVMHFAYPFGQPEDYSGNSKRMVQEAGFKTAVTTVWGFNPPQQDLFELKRFCPWESDVAMFALKLDWYRLAGVQLPADFVARQQLPAPIGLLG